MGKVRKAARIALGTVWRGVPDSELRDVVSGATVLVTGASSGIGAASARKLAAAGAELLLVARRTEELERLAREIRAAGGRARTYPTDIADIAAVERLLSELDSVGTRVDVLVNCAGKSINRSVRASANRFHDYTRTAGVNYLGPVRLTSGLLPTMRARGTGCVVNVSTVGVDLPAPGWGSYIASKTAFETWLRCISPEVRADGVDVTSIHFPLVRTAMSAPTEMLRRLPAMRAEEAADAVARAIVRRPRVLNPYWSRIAGLVLTAARTPTDALLTRYYKTYRALSRSRE